MRCFSWKKVLEEIGFGELSTVRQTHIYHLYFKINQATYFSSLISFWHSAEFESEPYYIQEMKAGLDMHFDGWKINGCSAVWCYAEH